MEKIEKQLTVKGVTLEMTAEALDWLGEKGYDPVFGARPLRRVIQNEIEDRLSEALLEERFGPGDNGQDRRPERRDRPHQRLRTGAGVVASRAWKASATRGP